MYNPPMVSSCVHYTCNNILSKP